MPCAGGGAVNPLGGGWVLTRGHAEVITLQQGGGEEEYVGAGQRLSDTAVFSCNKHFNKINELKSTYQPWLSAFKLANKIGQLFIIVNCL